MPTDSNSSEEYDYDTGDFESLGDPTPTDTGGVVDSESSDVAETSVNIENESVATSKTSGLSVESEEQGASNPKSTPKTGSTLRDLIYIKSWPGRERFERDESPILYSHPHWIAAASGYLSGIITSLLGTFLTVHYLTGATRDYLMNELPFGIQFIPNDLWLACTLALTLLGVVIFLHSYINRLHTWFIVTDQRTWVREGVLSKTDRGSLDHQNVNNVEEDNPFPLNQLGIGHVRLYTASTDGVELVMKNMKDPSKWAQTIRNEKQNKHRDNTPPATDEDDV